MGMKNDIPALEAITVLGWETLALQRAKTKAVQMYKVFKDFAPADLSILFMRKSNVTNYELRGSSTSLQMPFPSSENFKSFSYEGAKLLNSLHLICVILIH